MSSPNARHRGRAVANQLGKLSNARNIGANSVSEQLIAEMQLLYHDPLVQDCVVVYAANSQGLARLSLSSLIHGRDSSLAALDRTRSVSEGQPLRTNVYFFMGVAQTN